MTTRPATDPMSAKLLAALPEFEICCRRALEGMLGKPTYGPRDFRLSPGPGGTVPPGCVIRSGNDRFGILLSVGLDKPDQAVFLPEAGSEEEVADAIGEIANVIAGNFLGRPGFRNLFGPMRPTPPVYFHGYAGSSGSRSIQGVLMVGTARLNLGFLLHPIHKDVPL